MSNKTITMLKKHEGLELYPYEDTVGKTTIGYGHNIDDNGISQEIAEALLVSDLHAVQIELTATFDWYYSKFPWPIELDEVRKSVIDNMAFNMGVPRLKTFKKMIQAMEDKDYEEAANQMLDSKWADQVKGRAIELSDMMRTGKWLT